MPCVFAVTWFTCYNSTVIHDLNTCDETCLLYRQGFKYAEDLLTHYEIVFVSVKSIQVYCGFKQVLTKILQTLEHKVPF